MDTEIFEANGYLKDENVVQMLSQLPKLQGKDVADALLYVLGTPPHVQVLLAQVILSKFRKIGAVVFK